ncbi:MAG: leucine-rich repeat protein, partial [Opitutales bacterium]
LATVTIPESVTSIGSNAFSSCSSLATVTIPDSVTSIGSNAFNNCSSLASITIGNGVTSIGSDAFDNCSSLTSITFEGPPPAFDLYTLTGTSSEPLLYYKTYPEAYRVYKETYNLPLVYLGPPIIQVQPQGAIATSGETVNLSVSATDVQGSALTYQWMRNGVDIADEVSATLSISSIASSDSGSYQVKVTNNEGTTVSEAANVSLVASQLYTQQQYDAALTTGFNLGVQSAQNAQADGWYTEEQLVDLRAGSVLLTPQSNGSATLSLQIERSDDLNTWTSHPDDLVEVNMPMPQGTQFYRFKMGD